MAPERFKFRVLQGKAKSTDGAQLFVTNKFDLGDVGDITFDEIPERLLDQVPDHIRVYEIKGERLLTPDESRKVLNEFYSRASDASFLPFEREYKQGVEFTLRGAA